MSFRGQGHYLPPNPNYTLNVNGERVKQKGYITDELTDYAVEWLEGQDPARRPFFLYLSHKAVHANFTPAERHEGTLADAPFERPASEADTFENYRGQAQVDAGPAQQLARRRLSVLMVKIGGIAQAIMLPVIGGFALFLRYRRMPKSILPKAWVTLVLWVSAVLMALLMGYSAITRL